MFAATAAFSTPFAPSASAAVNIEATCDGPETCDVQVTGDKITTSNGDVINADNVISWGFVNDNSNGGVFYMNNEDYRILIKYFDESGSRQLTQIGFYNFKTAQSFVNALELTTGLAPDARQSSGRLACTGFSLATAKTGPESAAGEFLAGAVTLAPAIAAAANPLAAPVVASALNTRGTFELDRNFVSEIRKSPASSGTFVDGVFDGRRTCEAIPSQSTGTTSITVNN